MSSRTQMQPEINIWIFILNTRNNWDFGEQIPTQYPLFLPLASTIPFFSPDIHLLTCMALSDFFPSSRVNLYRCGQVPCQRLVGI